MFIRLHLWSLFVSVCVWAGSSGLLWNAAFRIRKLLERFNPDDNFRFETHPVSVSQKSHLDADKWKIYQGGDCIPCCRSIVFPDITCLVRAAVDSRLASMEPITPFVPWWRLRLWRGFLPRTFEHGPGTWRFSRIRFVLTPNHKCYTLLGLAVWRGDLVGWIWGHH